MIQPQPEPGDFITSSVSEIEAEIHFDLAQRVKGKLEKGEKSGLWNTPKDFLESVEVTTDGKNLEIAADDEATGQYIEQANRDDPNLNSDTTVVRNGKVNPIKATPQSLSFGVSREYGDERGIVDWAVEQSMEEGQKMLDSMHRPDERKMNKKKRSRQSNKEFRG